MSKGNYDDKNGKQRGTDKRRGGSGGYDAPFRGYINLNLSSEQKAAFAVWSQSESFWEALSFHVADGIILSLKIDGKSEGFIASATQRRETSVNAGLVVTARGGSPEIALGRVLYCLTILSHTESWEATQPIADPDRW